MGNIKRIEREAAGAIAVGFSDIVPRLNMIFNLLGTPPEDGRGERELHGIPKQAGESRHGNTLMQRIWGMALAERNESRLFLFPDSYLQWPCLGHNLKKKVFNGKLSVGSVMGS